MEALRIGGITPLTGIDYPGGYLSAVVFCQGCPWRCRYCHNAHLLSTRAATRMQWTDVVRFLERRRGLLDAVVFSGGEPTLQKALPGAVRSVRQLGFRVGLHTAGCYPERLKALLPDIDWVGLDIKQLPDKYPDITQVPGSGERAWQSLELILASGAELEVRTTLAPGFSDEQLSSLTDALSRRGVRNFTLQTCHTEHALEPDLSRMPPCHPSGHLIRTLEQTFSEFTLR